MKPEEAVGNVRKGAGWVRLDRLSLIRVTGPNRVKFLHGLLSNDIAGLNPGSSRLAALMNLKGQQVAWMRVMAEADALTCEVPTAVRDKVVEIFIHYKVGAPVRFEKPDAVVFGLFGAKAPETVVNLGFPGTPGETESFLTIPRGSATLRVCRGLDMPAQGFTLHTESSDEVAVEEKLRAFLGEAMSQTTLDTLRVEEGIPWHGVDVTEENLLHETGQLAILHSSTKGCYLGQEVVARLEGRGGNVNKRLCGLKLAEGATAGSEIFADDKVVGRITSVGQSKTFGAIAMGFVHRSHADPGSRVVVAGSEATVAALPFTS